MSPVKSRKSAAANKSVRSFGRLAKDYYDQTFERFPVTGAGAGIRKLNSQLGSARPSVHERQLKLAEKTLRAVEEMPIHDFEGEDWLDRMTLRSHLRQEVMQLGELRTWQTNPQIYLDTVAESIFGLLIRHGDNLRPVAPALVSRLRAIPKYLDQAVENIHHPVPLWVELTKASAPGIRSLLLSLPAPLAEVSDRSEASITQLCKRASAAVTAYASRVGRRAAGPENGFSVGTERFETLIRDRLGLQISSREAISAAQGLAAGIKAEMKAEARRFHPRKSAHEILQEATQAWTPGGRDMLGAYTKETARIRAQFRRAKAMTFPKGETLEVKLVPDFMIHQFPTAAYSAPGPLERQQKGIFWVNDLSLKLHDAAAKRREIAQHYGIELTCAHEAYPGHHLQFVTQFKHPSLVRKMADHSIYYEGWTLWCEQMCVDLQVSDNPYLKLIQLHDALWRANRIVIDCGLQTGSLDYKGACRVLQREVGFTKARAQADVNWYTSSPTVPMSYLLGKMELVRLKRQRVDGGGWTLKQFNDWVLKFGAIPWSWIEASGL